MNDPKTSWLYAFMDEIQKLAPKTSWRDEGVWCNGHMYHGQGLTPKRAAVETLKQLPRLTRTA